MERTETQEAGSDPGKFQLLLILWTRAGFSRDRTQNGPLGYSWDRIWVMTSPLTEITSLVCWFHLRPALGGWFGSGPAGPVSQDPEAPAVIRLLELTAQPAGLRLHQRLMEALAAAQHRHNPVTETVDFMFTS